MWSARSAAVAVNLITQCGVAASYYSVRTATPTICTLAESTAARRRVTHVDVIQAAQYSIAGKCYHYTTMADLFTSCHPASF